MHDGLCIASYSEYYTYTRHVDQTSLYCCGHSCSLLLYTCVCVACICELLDVCVFFLIFHSCLFLSFRLWKRESFNTRALLATQQLHTHTHSRTFGSLCFNRVARWDYCRGFFLFFLLPLLYTEQPANSTVSHSSVYSFLYGARISCSCLLFSFYLFRA